MLRYHNIRPRHQTLHSGQWHNYRPCQAGHSRINSSRQARRRKCRCIDRNWVLAPYNQVRRVCVVLFGPYRHSRRRVAVAVRRGHGYVYGHGCARGPYADAHGHGRIRGLKCVPERPASERGAGDSCLTSKNPIL